MNSTIDLNVISDLDSKAIEKEGAVQTKLLELLSRSKSDSKGPRDQEDL